MSEALEGAREQRAGLRAAIGRVESALASPASGRAAAWAAELRTELDALAAAFDHHVVITEARDGLLEDIVAAAPRLANKVDRTRREHVSLRADLDRALGLLSPDDSEVGGTRDRVVELLAGLVRHRQLGADLVYEAYSVDIEAGD